MSEALIIDDDEALCRSLQIQLQEEGHAARFALNVREGLALLEERQPDLVILDYHLPDMNGLVALRAIHEQRPHLPVAIITGVQEMKVTIEAMRSGAFDYLRKPFELGDILLLMEKAARIAPPSRARGAGIVEDSIGESREIVSSDKKMVEVIKQIGLLSQNRVNVLVQGESGTGKELVARAIHDAGAPGAPFVAINCSAFVPTLLGSELFGHERGAFTGALSRKIGKLEHAGEGTVFLDEIGDMPLDLQAKILRVLQERVFERVGGLDSIPFRARVIAATHRDLEDMIHRGEFRQDLYFRLAVTAIQIPPLRERRADIRVLARHLLARIGQRLHRPATGIHDRAMRRLETYDWPGNVRELENVLTRAVALSRGPLLTEDDLSFVLQPSSGALGSEDDIRPLNDVEKDYIEKALRATDWNITRTARQLQISPTTLRKKIADYRLRQN